MEREVRDFLTEFKAALGNQHLQTKSASALKKARRTATNLAAALHAVEGDTPDIRELSEQAVQMVQKLKAMEGTGASLDPMIKKARAMLSLEGMFNEEVINQVQELLHQAQEFQGKNQDSGLPFLVAVECMSCSKLIVGETFGGSKRWGNIRYRVTRHDNELHEGFSSQEKLALRAIRKQIQESSEEISLKQYRFFRNS